MKHIVAGVGIIAACFVGCGSNSSSSDNTGSGDGKGGQGTGGSAGEHTGGAAGGHTGGTAGLYGSGGNDLADTCKLELLDWGHFETAVSSESKLEGPAVTATQEGFVVHYGETTPNPKQSRAVSWNVRRNEKATLSVIGLTSCPDNDKYQWTGFATVFDPMAFFDEHDKETPTGVLVALGACYEHEDTVMNFATMNYIQFNGRGVHDVQSHRFYNLGRPYLMSTAPTKSFALNVSNGEFFLALREENKPRPIIFRFENGHLVTDSSGLIEGHTSQVDEFQIASGNGRIAELARTSDGLLYKASTSPGGKLTQIDKTKGTDVSVSSLATNLENNNVLIAYVSDSTVKWLLDTGNATFSKSGDITASLSQPKSIDVARANNGFIVAVGESKDIHLYHTVDLELEQPSTKWNNVALAQELAKMGDKASNALMNYSGQRVAVATNDKLVLVSWLNQLEATEVLMSAGGYALLLCEEK